MSQNQGTANVVMTIGTDRLRMSINFATGPTELREIVPVARSICGTVSSLAIEKVESAGEKISCKAGCGACCRQLVPMAPVEAHLIAELVANMPEPRQSVVRERFADAKRRLQEGGLWDRLQDRAHWPLDGVERFGLEYFALGIECPFLEDESCSIHPDRPLACREYLVTSPAEECARPTRDSIRMVPIAKKVWPALARFHPIEAGQTFLPWVPLILAPDWSAEHPDATPPKPGPALLQEFLQFLSGANLPGETPFESERFG